MFQNLLLPNRFKKLGWGLLLPATILGIIQVATSFDFFPIPMRMLALFHQELFGKSGSFQIISINITPTITGILFLTGALMVSFSREKKEDEFIMRLRQSSLLWAVLVNYILLLLSFVFIYGTAFLDVMLYNMFTILIIFIIRFHYILYRTSKDMPHEKYHQGTTSY